MIFGHILPATPLFTMLSSIELKTETLLRILFLTGLSVALFLVVTFFRSLVDKQSKFWHHVPAAAIGVDAAERGDTKRLLLEKVPYDLQKRAILHKVRFKNLRSPMLRLFFFFCASLPLDNLSNSAG